MSDRHRPGSAGYRSVLTPDCAVAVAQAGGGPTLEGRALQDAPRRVITTRRGPCSCREGGIPWIEDFCFVHLPGADEQRDEARRKGGRNRSNAVRAQRRVAKLGIHDTRDILSIAALDLLSGEMQPGVANAPANVCKAIIAAQQYGEMADDLAALLAESERLKQERAGHG